MLLLCLVFIWDLRWSPTTRSQTGGWPLTSLLSCLPSMPGISISMRFDGFIMAANGFIT